jgi:4-alpha-glucanotransferase
MSDASNPARLVPFVPQYRASGMLLHVTDSSDMWVNPELFLLDERHRPLFVAAPPDYFSAQGQLWGKPIYD